jgi:tetratricopeptide (TPR) repeat protein
MVMNGPQRLPVIAAALAVLAATGAADALAGCSGGASQPEAVQELRQAIEASDEPVPAPLALEDVPEILQAVESRTEAEEDRLHALSLFTTARTLERDKNEARALRLYERALRYDPDAVTVARAIVPLAHRLGRHAEAVRYALKAIRYEDADPALLRRLGIYLTENGEWQRAVTLYERALAARQDAEPSAADVLLRMEMARIYHLANQYEKAAETFDWVLQALKKPEDYGLNEEIQKALLGDADATYNLIGECFFQAGRNKKATAAFKKANKVKPNRGRLGYNLARVALKNGKPQRALSQLQAYFDEKLADDGLAPYEVLADALRELGKEEELVSRLEDLQAKDPENVSLGYFLAGRHLDTEDYAKAESLYRMVVKENPTVVGYQSLLKIYREANRPEQLLDVLAEAAAKTSALEPLGEEAKAITENEELVQTLIDVAKKRLEDDAEKLPYDHRLAIALAATDAKRYDVADEFYRLAIDAQPDKEAELLLGWGLGLLVDEKYGQAADVFQRGIDREAVPEDNPVFHHYLAGALEMDGRTDEALAAARKAAEIKDDSPRFLSRVAWILYHAERNGEAAEVYRELIDRFDSKHDSAEVRQVLREARLVLSNIHVLRGETAEAEEYLEQLLDEFPDDISALNDLGYLWADENQHLQRAYRMIQQAVDGDPENAAYRDSLGWVLYRLQRVDEALVELEKAAEAEPDPVILDHLGDAYHASGKPDRAKEKWKQAVHAFREKDEQQKVEEVQRKIEQLDSSTDENGCDGDGSTKAADATPSRK